MLDMRSNLINSVDVDVLQTNLLDCELRIKYIFDIILFNPVENEKVVDNKLVFRT